MLERLEALFDELRQRRAFRFLILSIGAGWALLQVAEFAVENYALSQKLLDITLFLLVVGLPTLLVLIWFHGERGHQRVQRSEALLLALLGLAAVGGTWALATREGRAAPDLEPGQVAVDLGEHSLAVLPFRNGVTDPELGWLDRGEKDARIVLGNLLSQVEGREAEAARLIEETVLLDPRRVSPEGVRHLQLTRRDPVNDLSATHS